jgi:hypothetical protein
LCHLFSFHLEQHFSSCFAALKQGQRLNRAAERKGVPNMWRQPLHLQQRERERPRLSLTNDNKKHTRANISSSISRISAILSHILNRISTNMVRQRAYSAHAPNQIETEHSLVLGNHFQHVATWSPQVVQGKMQIIGYEARFDERSGAEHDHGSAATHAAIPATAVRD